MTANQNGGLAVTLPFAGEERTFRLGIGQWREIQARCDAGPEEIMARLMPSVTAIDNGLTAVGAAAVGLTGKWRIDDVRHVLLHGLKGAGMSDLDASRLIIDHFDTAHIRQFAALAFAIVIASLEGLPESKKPGEGDAGPKTKAPGRTRKSTSRRSTPAPDAPDSHPGKPTT